MDIDIIGKPNDWTLFTHKNLFGLISRKAEICRTLKINASSILSSSAKGCRVYTIILISSTKPHQALWFNLTHLLFQNMSVKIYTIFLSSGGYNFKINYLKGKLRHGIWVYILLNNLASSPLQHEYYFWHRRSKCYEKAIKFYPEIFEFKVFAA